MHQVIQQREKQQGAALIVSLLLLIMLTIVGITSMSNTRLEQQMSGNSQDKRLSFQMAELALRDGERQAFNNILSRRTHQDGIYDHSSGGSLSVLNGFDWDNANPANGGQPEPTGGTTNEGYILFTGEFITGGSTIVLRDASDPNGLDDDLDAGAKTKQIPRYAIENLGQSRIRNVGKTIPKVTRFRITSRGTGLASSTHTFLQSTLGKLE